MTMLLHHCFDLTAVLATPHSQLQLLASKSMCPRNHASLPRLPTLQLRPAFHGTHLHTNHPLVPILRLKVTHPLALLNPRVPHHRVRQVVAHYVNVAGAVFLDCRRVLRNAGVDAVDFGGYGQGGVRFGVCGCVEDFVDVRDAKEAGDGGLAYILLGAMGQLDLLLSLAS